MGDRVGHQRMIEGDTWADHQFREPFNNGQIYIAKIKRGIGPCRLPGDQ